MQLKERIEIDFRAALHRAEVLEEAADQLRRVVNVQLENALQHTGSGWHGENADLFRSKCSILSSEVDDTANDIRHVALGIRIAAKVMYQAEMNALQLVTNGRRD